MNKVEYTIKSWSKEHGEREEIALSHTKAMNIWSRLIHTERCDRVEVWKYTPIRGNVEKIMTYTK